MVWGELNQWGRGGEELIEKILARTVDLPHSQQVPILV